MSALHTVTLPPSLLPLFPGCSGTLTVSGRTVADLFDALDAAWPGMRDRLCDATPAIRRHINVFVNGEKARLGTALPGTSEVFVMTAISGG